MIMIYSLFLILNQTLEIFIPSYHENQAIDHVNNNAVDIGQNL